MAEELERPLYRLDAGDVGSSTYGLEGRLETALKRCAHWNAILLLDEADVFLEARSVDDIHRNELVASK